VRQFGHHSGLDCFLNQLLVRADQFLTFCKFGIIHVRLRLRHLEQADPLRIVNKK
jgi:hypothetical protein